LSAFLGWTLQGMLRKFAAGMSFHRKSCLGRAWPWVLLLALVSLVRLQSAETGTPAAPVEGPRRPNIILIVADDLGYGDLGCYGQKQIQTPNLDHLAQEGTRFTSFYAGSAVDLPSRSALMTGQHTGHTRIRGNAALTSLGPDDVTVASLLQAAGYRTGLIGKWGLGGEGSPGTPHLKGFFEFVGFLDEARSHDYYASYVDRYDGNSGYEGPVAFPDNDNGARGKYLPDLLATSALNFISINKPDFYNRYRPFFLYLAYTLPQANNERAAATGNGMEIPSDAPYSSEHWPQSEKNRAAMITRLDADIGRLLAKLHDLKQDTNTLILFTSDNGPHSEGGTSAKFFQSAGSLRGIKGELYEGGIRVPLIARWPGMIPAGRVCAETWAFWDLLPTIAAAANAKTPGDIDGRSFLPALCGAAQTNRHDHLYWELHEQGFQQAVRMGDWKAVRPAEDAPLELYNLASDPAEAQNVAAANSNILARIEKYLRSARTDSPLWPVTMRDERPAPSAGESNRQQ
jgi:arylsulfatase A-like enzyme